MSIAKISLLVVWAVLGGAFLASSDSFYGNYGRLAFWLTVVAHLVEFGVFQSKLRARGGSLGGHFLNTLIFGLFHIREDPQSDAATAE